MKSFMKTSLMALILSFTLSAETTRNEPIIIATDTAFFPFEFKQGKEYVGFDIDITKAIFKNLGLSYSLKTMDFNGIIPALQTKNIDLAIAGISINEARKKAIDFSDPYYLSSLQVVVRSDNDKITNIKDLEGKIVAVKSGTSAVDYIKANLKIKELRQFPNIDNAYLELGIGRADAVLHDTPNLKYYIKKAGNGRFKMVGDPIEAQPYGIAFPKKSPLIEKVNAALKNLREDGKNSPDGKSTYDKIYNKWFGTKNNE